MPPQKKNKKNKGKKKSSVKEYLGQIDDLQTSSEEFMRCTAAGIRKLTQEQVKLMQSNDPDTIDKQMREMVKPMDVTSEVIAEIKNIPISESIAWYVGTSIEHDDDNSTLCCTINLLDTESHKDLDDDAPNDYLLENKKNRVQMYLGRCMFVYDHDGGPFNFESQDEKRLVIGTIAKTIFGNGMPMPFMNSMSHLVPKGKKIKPKRLLFQSSGLMNKVAAELEAMGIPKKHMLLAHSEIVQEVAVRNKIVLNSGTNGLLSKMMNVNPDDDHDFGRKLGMEMKKSITPQIPYVSETRKPLKNFSCSTLPPGWLCRPPKRNDDYRLTRLLGWRTNLELAVTHMDDAKVREITHAHSVEEVREFCEIRALLFKMAQEGLVKACKLLLEFCHVSPEGPRDSDFPAEWKQYTIDSGWDDQAGGSPLIVAAKNGQYEACKVLLEYKASIHTKCFRVQSPALHHAMSQGHKDVVKLLCQHNADMSVENIHGLDAIDLISMFQEPASLASSEIPLSTYQKIEEVLREYDDRCSYCKEKQAVMKRCPCRKERYCGIACQKKRWANHKTLHKRIMSKKESENV